MTAVYATVLAVRARGTPNQALINAFAAYTSQWVMAVLGVLLTFLLGRQVARECAERRAVTALMLGVTSAVISLVPAFVLRGVPSLRSLLIAACVALAGWAGGAIAARQTVTAPPQS